jgi:hypothetical protein
MFSDGRDRARAGCALGASGAAGLWTSGEERWRHAVRARRAGAGVNRVVRRPQGEPKVHTHVVVGKADGTAHGGHLIEAHVRPTLEVVLVEPPQHLQRQSDPESGLALIRL